MTDGAGLVITYASLGLLGGRLQSQAGTRQGSWEVPAASREPGKSPVFLQVPGTGAQEAGTVVNRMLSSAALGSPAPSMDVPWLSWDTGSSAPRTVFLFPTVTVPRAGSHRGQDSAVGPASQGLHGPDSCRLLTQGESRRIRPFVAGLFYFPRCPQVHPRCSLCRNLILGAEQHSVAWTDHTTSVQSSTDRRSGGVHILTIVNDAAGNLGVQTSQYPGFHSLDTHMPQGRTAGPHHPSLPPPPPGVHGWRWLTLPSCGALGGGLHAAVSGGGLPGRCASAHGPRTEGKHAVRRLPEVWLGSDLQGRLCKAQAELPCLQLAAGRSRC